MSITSTNLLAALGAGVNQGAHVEPCEGCAEDLDFGELLALARSGRIGGHRLLQIGAGVGVELTPMQLAEISRAADAADAAGLRRTLAVYDGTAMTIDVASRTIDSIVGDDSRLGELVTDIDSAVILTSIASPELEEEEAAQAARLGHSHFVLESRTTGSLGRVTNGALADALADAGVTLRATQLPLQATTTNSPESSPVSA